MKRGDLYLLLIMAAILLPFFLCDDVYAWYKSFNANHSYIMAFIKFGILSTLGEVIGLRIKTGRISEPGFGIIPRIVVWGVLGMWIASAMRLISVGAPALLESYGIDGISQAMKGGFTPEKLLGAFTISLFMNTTFAPVFMTIHKITDTHILNCKGGLSTFITPIPFGKIISGLNWGVQWNFVFKKTIPFFWIPAHTITFLLPAEFQVLFAALLGVALGVLLSVAAVKSRG